MEYTTEELIERVENKAGFARSSRCESEEILHKAIAEKLRQHEEMVEALELLLMNRHYHHAGDVDIDTCFKCGQDLRSRVHYRAGESEETDKDKARKALQRARDEL